MSKVFAQMKKYWKTNLVTFIIAIVLGVGVFCLIFFLRGRTILAAVDGAALGSVTILFLGLLCLVNHFGAFDTFAFGFKQLGSMIFSKNARKAGNYRDYKEIKAEKRSKSSYNFISVIAAGLLMSISIIVLEIIYHANIGA